MDLVFLAGIVITVATAIPVLLQLRSHPRGLFVLFFAEMWERFSYYGMRGLLIFYLTQHFLFDDKAAQGHYGAYTSLAYLIPLIGGVVADRWLGARKAVAFGALLLVAGHFTMAIEGAPAIQTLTYQGATYDFRVEGRAESRHVSLLVGGQAHDYSATPDGGLAIKDLPANSPLPSVLSKGSYQIAVKGRSSGYLDILYLALALIIMGVGFLKANISSIVGQLYRPGDPKRDPGFTLYYYGVNLGAFWAAVACGWLGERVGWWAGFGAAGVGMLLGYLAFVFGRASLEGKGEPPDPVRLARPIVGPFNTEWLIYIASIAGVGVVWALVQHYAGVGSMLIVGSALLLVYVGWYVTTKGTKVDRDRLILCLLLIVGSTVFWALYEQGGSSLNQFAERNTDLTIWRDNAMTAAQAQSFQSGYILILAPVFSALWAFMGRRGADPNPLIKFGLGIAMAGGSFYVIVFGAQFAHAGFKVPLFFLALAYLLQTTGELCLSPVGLSQMTKLAPAALISTMLAAWFLANAWANWLSIQIAQLTAADTLGGQVLDAGKSLATYVDVFLKVGGFGLAVGALFIAASPFLKFLAHGASDTYPMDPEPIVPVDGDRQTIPGA